MDALISMTPHWVYVYVNDSITYCYKFAPYFDIDYARWLLWLFTPIIITLLLPILLAVFFYGAALFLHIYKMRNKIVEAYNHSIWDGARSAIASFWDAQGWIWHGYELIGLENIPDDGPALIIYYHGTLPIDVHYLLAKCILYKGRTLRCVGDKFLFKIPGWRTLMEVFSVTPGTVESCVSMLESGYILTISPGGVREALFSSPRYEMLWGNRKGFAEIAMQSKAPVIPMFTVNCREAFRTPTIGRRFFRWLYEKTKLPLVPIYGGFPVKLKTYLGAPIHFKPGLTVDDVRNEIRLAVYDLIQKHQRMPGNILRALLDRFM